MNEIAVIVLTGFSTNILVRKVNNVLYNNQIINNLDINRTSGLSLKKTKFATHYEDQTGKVI